MDAPEMLTCTVCDGPFDIETEGGRAGNIGIVPVAFCPTCTAGIMDFAEQELQAQGWLRDSPWESEVPQ